LVPFSPNFANPVFNTTALPVTNATFDVMDSAGVAPVAVKLLTEVAVAGQLQSTFNAPISIDPGTETHSGANQWDFAAPSVSNTLTTGTLIQPITVTPPTINQIDVDVAKINIHSNWPITPGTPVINAGPLGSATVSSIQAVDGGGSGIRLNYSSFVPTCLTVQSLASGLVATFNGAVNAGAPGILATDPGAPVPTSIINPLSTSIKVNWTLASSGITLVSATGVNRAINLLFAANVFVTSAGLNPDNYSISTATPGAVVPTILSISYLNATVTVHTTDQTIGASYTLHMPPGAIADAMGGIIWTTTSVNFTGASSSPLVITAYAQTGTQFVLIFSEEVIESSATDLTHYGIVPALDIHSITKVNATTYIMNTSQQIPGQSYTVTITGVIDTAHNPI
jgi:hypothetical protein